MSGSTADLASRLRGGEVLLGTFLNLGSPVSAEICATAGFDWLVVDLEHSGGSEGSLLTQLQAVAAGNASGIVRVESHDRSRIGHALDAGASGIVAPKADSPEEAALVVAGGRYPPTGTRGVALMNRGARFGAAGNDLAAADERVVIVVQIESEAAVAAADDIAAVPGVDVLFVGPSDLSHSMGIFGQFGDPRFTSAVRAVARAAAHHGKAAGVLAASADDAVRYLQEGYRFVGVGGDGGFLASGARSAAADLAAVAARFR